MWVIWRLLFRNYYHISQAEGTAAVTPAKYESDSAYLSSILQTEKCSNEEIN